MKTNKLLWGWAVMACLQLGCTTSVPRYDNAVTLILDQTDSLVARPNIESLIEKLHINENPYQGVCIKVTSVSDYDVNDTKTISLERENGWSGTLAIRKGLVERFKSQLQAAISQQKFAGPRGHSIIYRTVVKQLNLLAASDAKTKTCLIFSNFLENDELDFYDPNTMYLVKTNPGIIKRSFEKTVPITHLQGVQVWMVYQPVSYDDNNTFMSISRIYQQLLGSKGAEVHIENSYN